MGTFFNLLKSFIFSVFKLNIKDYFFIIILIIMGFLLVQKNCQLTKLQKTIKIETPQILPADKKTDKKGTEYSQIKETVFTQKQMDHITDSFRKVLKVTKVNHVTTEVSSLKGEVRSNGKVFYLDTMKHTVFDSHEDKYMYVEYTGNLDTHYGLFKFAFLPDTATFISTSKNHWFRPNEHSVAIYHSNKYFNDAVVAGTSYTYKERKIRAVIGPSIGVQYMLKTHKIEPYIGIGITFNLIGLKSK